LPADLLEVEALVANLIPRQLGGGLTAAGLAQLRDYMRPGAIGARISGTVFPPRDPVLVALAGPRLVGYGAVREQRHISQIYVAEDWHRRGVGAALVLALVAAIRGARPGAETITLNAAPRAIELYRRLGFAFAGPPYRWHGAAAQPMALAQPKRSNGG
jgi:ribosomal protein S18 acetylase RimI-like enzyme